MLIPIGTGFSQNLGIVKINSCNYFCEKIDYLSVFKQYLLFNVTVQFTIMNYTDKAQDIYKRLIELPLANLGRIKGCTEEEIIFLENKYNINLPDSYKLYLELFGHGHGIIMDDVDILYGQVLNTTDYVKTRVFTEKNKPDKLPANIFVFASRYGEQFLFFDADLKEEDPPCYHYYWDNGEEITKYDESIWRFIELELELIES
jgi:hypothetical protein